MDACKKYIERTKLLQNSDICELDVDTFHEQSETDSFLQNESDFTYRDENTKHKVIYMKKRQQKQSYETATKKIYQCNSCKKLFNRLYNVQRHLKYQSCKKVRVDEKLSGSRSDNSVFNSKTESDVQNYTTMEHSELTGILLDENISADVKQEPETLDDDNIYECDNCKQTFKRLINLQRHEQSNSCHKDDLERAMRDIFEGIINEDTEDENKSTENIEILETENKEELECRDSDAIYEIGDELSLTSNLLLLPEKEVLIKTESDLKKRIRNKFTNSHEKIYQCNTCKRLFDRLYNIQRHQMRNFCKASDEKPNFAMFFKRKLHTKFAQKKIYRCEKCRKSFTRLFNLQRHQKLNSCRSTLENNWREIASDTYEVVEQLDTDVDMPLAELCEVIIVFIVLYYFIY